MVADGATTAHCIKHRDPWLRCPDKWTPCEPQRTSGGMIPAERCACGAARLVIVVQAEDFDELKRMSEETN